MYLDLIFFVPLELEALTYWSNGNMVYPVFHCQDGQGLQYYNLKNPLKFKCECQVIYLTTFCLQFLLCKFVGS